MKKKKKKPADSGFICNILSPKQKNKTKMLQINQSQHFP